MEEYHRDEIGKPEARAALVQAALRSQPLAETPPGLAEAVLQRLPERRVEDGLAWRAIALALIVVSSLVALALIALLSGLQQLVSPERLLRLQWEWWYWQQRVSMEWQARLGGWSSPVGLSFELVWWGAAVLFLAGGAVLLAASLGGGLQVWLGTLRTSTTRRR